MVHYIYNKRIKLQSVLSSYDRLIFSQQISNGVINIGQFSAPEEAANLIVAGLRIIIQFLSDLTTEFNGFQLSYIVI